MKVYKLSPLLIPANHSGQPVQCHPGLQPPVLQQLVPSPVTLKYLPTDPPHHLTPHSKILIHSGIRGSLNRDPPCSADTEPLTTRHPRRDDLTFVEQELSVRLFHYLLFLRLQYNITYLLKKRKEKTDRQTTDIVMGTPVEASL
jgi:hypothetical protein